MMIVVMEGEFLLQLCKGMKLFEMFYKNVKKARYSPKKACDKNVQKNFLLIFISQPQNNI